MRKRLRTPAIRIIRTQPRGSQEIEKRGNDDRDDHVRVISPFFNSLLERDCIAHLDGDGLRYYLPALMLSLLSDYDPRSMRVIGTIAALYPKSIGVPTRGYEYLTADQHRAVACFLNALPNLVTLDTEDSKCVARALRNYWGQFAAPLPQCGV